MEYSFMARLGCVPAESMSFREFLFHVDAIKKDVEKEEEQARKQAQKQAGARNVSR